MNPWLAFRIGPSPSAARRPASSMERIRLNLRTTANMRASLGSGPTATLTIARDPDSRERDANGTTRSLRVSRLSSRLVVRGWRRCARLAQQEIRVFAVAVDRMPWNQGHAFGLEAPVLGLDPELVQRIGREDGIIAVIAESLGLRGPGPLDIFDLDDGETARSHQV